MQSVLTMYADQVDKGQIDTKQAQALAKAWIDKLALNAQRFSFIFDHQLTIVASGKPELIGMDLSGLQDFKGHPLAASAYQEARTTGQSFAIYRWPDGTTDNKDELRYAYFSYFEPWDWVFAITDSALDISRQFDRRRDEMETAVREALVSLRLADLGFAFIVQNDGQLVSPLPERHAGLLTDKDPDNGKTLLEALHAVPSGGEIATFSFGGQEGQSDWEISAAHFKPLGWTIVAAVPRDDLTRPATQLLNRLGVIFLGILLISLIVAWFLSARITRPLQQLSAFARKLPEQDLSAEADRTEEHTSELKSLMR